jgi:hypothetical protein
VGQAASLLDEQVDGFGAAVADLVGVEPSQHVASPLSQRASEPGNLGQWAGRERGDDLLGDASAVDGAGGFYMDLRCL